MLTRRSFITLLGAGTYELLRSSSSFGAVFPSKRSSAKFRKFKPIAPSLKDELILPKGYSFDRLISYGDPLGSKGPLGDEFFGADCDFLTFFPLSKDDGLLWVNHEYLQSLLVSGVLKPEDKTKEQILKEKLVVGGSVVHIRRVGKKWEYVQDKERNHRFTALYPEIQMTGPARVQVPMGKGTLANCSGGKTPWNTVLSCEENFQLFNDPEYLGWEKYSATKIDEKQYGWVVEIDPFRKLAPKKHTALGRFCHENAAWRVGGKNKFVVYMGDDSKDQYFYKFISAESFNPKASREEQSKLLEAGTLYAADFSKGKWIALDWATNPILKETFDSQAHVLMETRAAAKAVKATPLDRSEDCEIHPLDGSVYLSLTNNSAHGNAYGQIVRLVEKGDDAEAIDFRYEIFLAGGPQSGLAAPDNLCFDKQGNLWVCCDVTSSDIGKGAYESFGNCGMFFVPTAGANAGNAFQFASAPVQAELTGPWFDEDESTLFLSVQHPGELTTDLTEPKSRWPLHGSALPLSSVVAIQGFKS
jgi:secreted PhoX family phosphatase